MKLSVSRSIDLSAQRAWELLTDWERQGSWMPATDVRIVGDDRSGVGTRLRAATGFGPIRLVDTMDITEWDPPRRCVTRHTGRILRGSGIFELAATSQHRCQLTWTEDVELPAILDVAPIAALARLLVEPFLGLALRRFSRIS